MIDYLEIARFIVKTVQKNALLSGFQYIVGYTIIEKAFNIKLCKSTIDKITLELEYMEEVADVECDEYGFDVVLYTDYAPNYVTNEN